MRLLLDAHAIVWALVEPERLSDQARTVMNDAEEPLVGSGTLIEIAVKQSVGKLPMDDDWPERLDEMGVETLAFAPSHAARLQNLPFPKVAGREHRDPFDRALVAQALAERLPIVTRDPAIASYGVPVIW